VIPPYSFIINRNDSRYFEPLGNSRIFGLPLESQRSDYNDMIARLQRTNHDVESVDFSESIGGIFWAFEGSLVRSPKTPTASLYDPWILFAHMAWELRPDVPDVEYAEAIYGDGWYLHVGGWPALEKHFLDWETGFIKYQKDGVPGMLIGFLDIRYDE